MIHLFRLFVIILLLTCFLSIDDLYAGDEKTKEKCVPSECIKEDGKSFTITGMNYCVACGLKEAYGAAAQCKVHGHQHGLNVSKLVTPCGKDRSECVGKTFYYLANDKSKQLREGLNHQTVQVTGKLYWDQNMIEVESFMILNEE